MHVPNWFDAYKAADRCFASLCTLIDRWLKTKKIDGNLDLYDTNIIKLPDNLTVDGDLDLSGTSITELPDNLKVNGNIYR